MKYFRTLRADEIECRVSTINKNGLSLLLYKTARTDADLLDETVGAENWENDYKLIDGVLFCGIGVRYAPDTPFVWKWNNGVESYTEAEKGRASDAFKRAGFNHGIGRELYSAPFIWIKAADCNIKEGNNGKLACYDNFIVSLIEYDVKEHICRVRITNTSTGKEVFKWSQLSGENAILGAADKPEALKHDDLLFRCDECGEAITDTTFGGKKYSLREWTEGTRKRFGKTLCKACRQRIVSEGANENQ